MRKLSMLGAAMILFTPIASRAQLSVGLRLGYATALGDSEKGEDMSDGLKSQVPVQLDLTYRITKGLSAGLYLAYGFAQLGGAAADLCSFSSARCSASVLRFGAQATHPFKAVSPNLVPWVGVGLGYEIASVDFGGGAVNTRGFELLNVQGGADFKVNEELSVGPYLQISVGRYSTSAGNDLIDKGTHEWLSLGFRGRVDL